jgi:putative aldouronate transport system permease protein
VTVREDRATAVRRHAPPGGQPPGDRRSSCLRRASVKLRRASAKLRRDRALLLLAVPGLGILLLFQYVPLLGNIIAFENYEPYLGIRRSQWSGLANFSVIFDGNPAFVGALKNTLIITLLQVFFVFPVPIALALLLNSLLSERLKRMVQSVLYLPHFLSWVVVVAIFQEMFGDSGLLDDWLRSHGHATISIIGNAGLFKEMIAAQVIWKDAGWATILFLAALSQIDAALYEAASVDGAGRWRQLRHITLPGLKSMAILLFILQLGTVLSTGFEQIILQQGPVGIGNSEVMATYVYHNGILGGQWGQSAAVGLVNGLVGVALVLGANKLAHLFGEQGLYQS